MNTNQEVSLKLKKRVDETILMKLEQLETAFGKSFPFPTVTYDQRGRIAGKAVYSEEKIKLNPVLLGENEESFLQETVPHELAHLIAVQIYGPVGHGHGRFWKKVMMEMGVTPRRTHSYDCSSVSKPRQWFIYKCACGTKNFSKRRHNNVLRGSMYTCSLCHGRCDYSNKTIWK